MRLEHGFFDRLGTIEASFTEEGPWRGRFELDGHAVRCVLDTDEWLRLSVPVAGPAVELVRQQAGLRSPVKIVSGPGMLAELPAGEDIDSTFDVLREAMRRGLASLNGDPATAAVAEKQPVGTDSPLEALLGEAALDWTRAEGVWSATIDNATVVAESGEAFVTLSAGVAPLDAATEQSLQALADFVLALNGRLRFARGLFAPGRLVLESVLPIALVVTGWIDCAVREIATNRHRTRRALRVLLNPHVAEQYREFHSRAEPEPNAQLWASRFSKL